MRAVNLIPAETRRRTLDGGALRGPGPAVVGLLAVAVVLVTMYVLSSNSISQRQTELSNLHQQIAQTQAESGILTRYSQFTQLAQTRVQTVRDIAASRFDWAKALSELADVVPADTTLTEVSASVDPGATASGSGSGGSTLRGDIASPAFELLGCTASQDDVARLMSRLRLIDDVTRVTLSNSAKPGSSGAPSSASCGPNAPSFDLVVFFQPPAGAPVTTSPAGTAPSTPTPPPATPASTSTGGTS
jgi:Tfp pilus assembly protein PilN